MAYVRPHVVVVVRGLCLVQTIIVVGRGLCLSKCMTLDVALVTRRRMLYFLALTSYIEAVSSDASYL